MRAEDVGKLAVETDRGVCPLKRREPVHARHDRARRVGETDGHPDVIHPVVEHRGPAGPHAVALVAVVPCGNGGMVLHLLDEILHKTRLPHDRLGIDENVALLEHRRNKLSAGHPARHDADDKLDVMLLRHIAEHAETRHHFIVHARPVRKRLVVLEPVAAVVAARETVARQGLEIAPQREHTHHARAVTRQSLKLLIRNVGPPLAPHVHAGVLRPIVAADEKLTVSEYVPRGIVGGRRGHTRHGGQNRRKQCSFLHFDFSCLLLDSWLLLEQYHFAVLQAQLRPGFAFPSAGRTCVASRTSAVALSSISLGRGSANGRRRRYGFSHPRPSAR